MPAIQGFAASPAATIQWDASASAVQAAIEAFPSVGAGNVAVTSPSPGGGTLGGPYTIEFKGKFADTNVAPLTTNPNNLTIGSGTTKTATRTTPVEGASGFEVCTLAGDCQAGVPFALGVQEGTGTGQFAGSTPTRIAESASGQIFTVEPTTNLRLQKFTVSGGAVTAQGSFCGGGPAPGELCGSTSAPTNDFPPMSASTPVPRSTSPNGSRWARGTLRRKCRRPSAR